MRASVSDAMIYTTALTSTSAILSSKEQLPDEEIDEEGFELDDFLYGNAFENIADFLCCLDDDDIFTFGDSGMGNTISFIRLPIRGDAEKKSRNLLRKFTVELSASCSK
jgi:hypothetical protein